METMKEIPVLNALIKAAPKFVKGAQDMWLGAFNPSFDAHYELVEDEGTFFAGFFFYILFGEK